MTVKRAARILENRENSAVTLMRMKSALKRLRRGDFSQRMYDAVKKYLLETDFVLNRRGIIEYIAKAQDGFDFTYKEFFSLSDHIARVIYDFLDRLETKKLENAVNSLRTVDLINCEILLSGASRTERYLSSRGDIYYDKWSCRTKTAKRNAIIKYAEKRCVTELEAAIRIADQPIRKQSKTAGFFYFITAAVLLVLFASINVMLGIGPVIALFLLFPLSQTAKDITDRIFASVCVNTTIPRFKLDSIPKDAATLVVIATLLTGERYDKKHFDALEDYYLSNRSENLIFGILGDICDCPEITSAEDEKIIDYALKRIEALNSKYGDRFALFIRQRRYSTGEGKFIAWERKRGAVLELVRLIKRHPTTFETVTADRMQLHSVKYIITLDSDTRLYPGAVFDLVGAMLYPENKAVVKDGRVISGYGIMQPRMDTALDSAGKSAFTSMLCGSGGIDVYSGASFDVYQNIFGEGTFCGKGIISVDTYFEILNNAFPEECILSHDLLEGERLRCGLLTDVVLCDSVPTNPISWFERHHRWARGDTQALPFALPYVRNGKGKVVKNPCSFLSVFKITDNLRRLLIPVFVVASVAGSSAYDHRRAGIVLLSALSYILVRTVLCMPVTARDLYMRFFSHVLVCAGHVLANAAFDISSLFYTAWTNLNAMIKSLYRMTVSKKHLLEWRTAESSELFAKNSFPYYFVRMFGSFAAGTVVFIYAPSGWYKLLGLFWTALPFASFLLSKKHCDMLVLKRANAERLKEYTEAHWLFFRKYVTSGDNFLPPDNVSFRNGEKTAHRTSPTNIGLYLLSVICACDLGYINVWEMERRLEDSLMTVERLEKKKGFLYNWYDTQTLEVIGKRFVSSVDCGNFSACLIALREGLKEYVKESRSIVDIISRVDALIRACSFSFFLDPERELLSVGYDDESKELTESCYDIYMTECRTASYIAVARADLGYRHWRALARILVTKGGYMGMLSWNGTMFEFFMPNLFLPVYRNSLEYEALNFAVMLQSGIRYHGVWGRSECAYAQVNEVGDYKYRAIGVSKLGIERDLDNIRAVSPYASFLACAVAPNSACANLAKLRKLGCYCEYGFYDSLDLSSGKPIPARCCMSHHVGMSIIAAHNALLENRTQRRFISCPEMRSVSDLLKERIPMNPKISKTRNIYPVLSKMNNENLRF